MFFHFGFAFVLFSIGFTLVVAFNLSKENRIKVILALMSTMLCLFVLEVSLRVSGTFMTDLEKGANGNYCSFLRLEKRNSWYRDHPPDTMLNYFRTEFKFERNTNSLGLSERPISVDKSNYRIIGLGDSFTEGFGVSQDSTWLRRLERQLNLHNSEIEVETINAGIGGSDPVYEYQLFKNKLSGLAPDLVILSINSSDIGDLAYRGGFERFRTDGTSGRDAPWWEWIYQLNHLTRLVAHNGFKLNHYLVSPSEDEEGRSRFVELIGDVVAKLNVLAQENNFDLLIVVHPTIHDFESEGYLDPEMGQFIAELKSSENQLIDLRHCFAKIDVTDKLVAQKYYWPIDRHFNQLGYNVYADCLYETVLEKVKREAETEDLSFTTQRYPQP
ncbi:SGNH/GDSL hydrolase family protein [Flavobacteriales bacterium]|nr:SGNH/GDSL hydrolase family protein [Flavobacteriales bacterium]